MCHDVLIVIPARLKSNRLKEKLLQPIANKSVLIHVCDRVSQCSGFADIIVATDSEIILDHITDAGFYAILTSESHTCGTERCAEVAKKYPKVPWIINVQGDEPFIDPEDIISLISNLRANNEPIATLYHPLNETDYLNPNTVKVLIDENDNAIDFVRVCEKANHIYQHIGVYGFKNEILQQVVKWRRTPLELERHLEQMRWLENGVPIKMVEAKSKSIGIDTLDDLIEARAHYNFIIGDVAIKVNQ